MCGKNEITLFFSFGCPNSQIRKLVKSDHPADPAQGCSPAGVRVTRPDGPHLYVVHLIGTDGFPGPDRKPFIVT